MGGENSDGKKKNYNLLRDHPSPTCTHIRSDIWWDLKVGWVDLTFRRRRMLVDLMTTVFACPCFPHNVSRAKPSHHCISTRLRARPTFMFHHHRNMRLGAPPEGERNFLTVAPQVGTRSPCGGPRGDSPSSALAYVRRRKRRWCQRGCFQKG
jgi:hypothetical protein